MNTVYIAAILTPVLMGLIKLGITPWFENPGFAPPILREMGLLGGVYKLVIAFIGFASQVSLLGVVIFGSASLLSAIGAILLGIVCGGVYVALCKNVAILNSIFMNVVTPGILTINLFVVHWLAWKHIWQQA